MLRPRLDAPANESLENADYGRFSVNFGGFVGIYT